jgi:hypothetical protein
VAHDQTVPGREIAGIDEHVTPMPVHLSLATRHSGCEAHQVTNARRWFWQTRFPLGTPPWARGSGEHPSTINLRTHCGSQRNVVSHVGPPCQQLSSRSPGFPGG